MTATDSALLLTAWATGLLGSTHCVGMCGGISAALSFALPEEARRGGRLLAFQLAYNTGRLLTYTLLGVAVGALAHGVLGSWAQSPWPRIGAGLFMVALGLYLAGWWLGLQKLERVGGSLWKYLEPLRKIVFPVNRYWKAIVAGGLWGFLPCGLVYSALALALARADAVMSGGVMLAFGLGTLPTLMVAGALAGRVRTLLQKTGTRRLAGLLVIAFGVWTAVQPLVMKHAHGGAGHGAHSAHGARANDGQAAAVPATDPSGSTAPMDHSGMAHGGTGPGTMDHSQMNHGQADHTGHVMPAAEPDHGGHAMPGSGHEDGADMPAMDHGQHQP